MKLKNNTKKPTYKRVHFDELDKGDVFEDMQGNVAIKFEDFNSCMPNAILLDSRVYECYRLDQLVYPLETTLLYERIVEGANEGEENA